MFIDVFIGLLQNFRELLYLSTTERVSSVLELLLGTGHHTIARWELHTRGEI